MLIDSVRVSKQARDQLLTLRRRTGIENWNVVCRWAFCASLAEPSRPRNQKIVTDSNVEMTWHTFAGEFEQVYEALLRHRCRQDGVEPTPEAMAQQFRLHLHRGISYLAGDPKVTSIAGLVGKAAGTTSASAAIAAGGKETPETRDRGATRSELQGEP